jgi:hypothetical protein
MECFGQSLVSLSADSLLSPIDSLSIFQLIDSLINMEPEKEKSQFAIRAGYNSNIVATGRPFELGAFGISSGASYFYKSGFFVDATGYWSPEYDPSYFLTVASIGFMKTGTKNFSFLAEYSRYFYNLSEEFATVNYLHNFLATAFYEYKKINARFDYSLYLGEKTGHRFSPTLSLNFEKRKWRGIRRISLYPTFSLMTGIEQVTTYEPLFKTRLGAIFRIRNGLPLYAEKENSEFGIMNYAFSFPLSVAIRNWGILVNYTYNVPKKLPNETTDLSNGGYLSFSIVRYFELKKK